MDYLNILSSDAENSSFFFYIFGLNGGFEHIIFSQSIPSKKGWDLISSAPFAPNLLRKSLSKRLSIKLLAF